MKQYDTVILVDEFGHDLLNNDGSPSVVGKFEAHFLGLLHKAVSVFIFNNRNELLLQKRAPGKYHSPNKWSNTCCTHPLPGETPLLTAKRRLGEEMGLEVALSEVFTFTYRAYVGNGLIENEFDHVFWGVENQDPDPNPAEVSDWNWVTIENLKQELERNPEIFTPWFRQCFDTVVNHWSRRQREDHD